MNQTSTRNIITGRRGSWGGSASVHLSSVDVGLMLSLTVLGIEIWKLSRAKSMNKLLRLMEYLLILAAFLGGVTASAREATQSMSPGPR
jgi:hypothetical protein